MFGRSALVVTVLWAALLSERASAQNCQVPVRRVAVTSEPASIVDIRNAGDGRLFLVEQAGRIRVLENGVVRATSFIDLSSVVLSGGERGLLSLAFHPNYPATPWFFVLYTSRAAGSANAGDVVIARYNVSTVDPNVANPSSARILLVIPHSLQSNHNGGQLQFGPLDDYLYASIGDGGGGCDSVAPGCNAQREDTLLGKLLRIDVDRDTGPYYDIPPDNPFAAPGGARDEIWAKGLRNPFRFSFDRQTADMWIGDVGQNSREEIDFQPGASAGGLNYGWKILEGTLCNTCSLTNCPAPVLPCTHGSLTSPIHEYPRDVGSTVIGGYVYRGALIPGLTGCYVFGDFGSGSIWAISLAQLSMRRSLLEGQPNLTTFGEDSSGELYASIDGTVYKILPVAAAVPASRGWTALTLAALLALAAIASTRRLARRL